MSKKKQVGRPPIKGGARTKRQMVLFHPSEWEQVERLVDSPGPWMRELALKELGVTPIR